MPLFFYRSAEVEISSANLDLLTIGQIPNMWTKKGNNNESYYFVKHQKVLHNFWLYIKLLNISYTANH